MLDGGPRRVKPHRPTTRYAIFAVLVADVLLTEKISSHSIA